MRLGTAAIRGVVGPLFVGHGTQKLFGWFDGHGIEGTGQFFESLGLRPGRRHALGAGLAEALGGLLLTLGALTPLGASMVSATMITAIRKVHLKNGPWSTQGGYEYNLVLLAAMVAVTESGPGRPSVDARYFPRLNGPAWAALQLAAGAAGSWAATALSEPEPEPEQAPEPTTTATEEEPRFTRPVETAVATGPTPGEAAGGDD